MRRRKSSMRTRQSMTKPLKELLILWSIPIIAMGWILYLAVQEEGLSWPPSLDFTGGTRLEYEIDDEDAIRKGIETSQERQLALERSQETFLLRLRNFDLSEIIVKPVGDNRIIVEVPGIEAILRVKEEIGNAAVLNFRLIVGDRISAEELLQLSEGERENFFLYEDTGFYYKVTDPVLDASGISYSGTKAEISEPTVEHGREPYVHLALNPDAAEDFADLTTEHYGERIAICLDNIIISAPEIVARGIRDPIITGDFTMAKAEDLAKILRSGPLPVSLNLTSENLVSPSLGRENFQRGLIALIGGIGLVILILVLTYADHLALLATLGICIVLQGAYLFIFGRMGWLTLSMISLSGLVVLMGISVDNLILVFEEFRSKQRGSAISQANLLRSLRGAFKDEVSIIVLANTTTLLTLAPLYVLEGPITDLVTIMGLGIVIALVITVWYARHLLTFEGFILPLESISPPRPLISTYFPLFSYSRRLLIFYMVAVIASITFIVYPGVELGLDFKGGTEIVLFTDQGIGTDNLQSYALDYFGERAEVKRASSGELGNSDEFRYIVWIPSTEQLPGKTVEPNQGVTEQALISNNPTAEEFVKNLRNQVSIEIRLGSVDLLGPTVIGLRFRAVLIAAVGGLFLLTVLIAVRYGGGYTIPVLLALILDGVIVVGAISLFRVPLSLPVVAAILTVIGYSINDSIVLCGHVHRELKDNVESHLNELNDEELVQIENNPELVAREYFGKILGDLSPRIIITSLTTIVVAAALWIAGQGILRDFGLVITLGVFIGTLSSVSLVAMRLKSIHTAETQELATIVLEKREEQKNLLKQQEELIKIDPTTGRFDS